MLALAVLGLSGCASIQVFLGLKMRLNDTPVSALTVSQFRGSGVAPGKTARLVAVATTPEGKQLVTEGAGRGKVLWDSFNFETSVVQLGKKGRVSLPEDPRLSEGQLPHVQISVKGHPEIMAEIDLPVRYDASFVADFSGSRGADGEKGSDGAAGDDGAAGSTDSKNPRPGGPGADGANGGNGGNGEAGQDGPNLQVWVTVKGEGHPLLQVKVSDGRFERLYLVDPVGGSLLVKADGGPGGAAGAGGRGGAGGSGGVGTPNGPNGSSGSDGSSGWPGRDGAAGTIFVRVDPQAKPFLSTLQFSNRNGYGQPGPAPVIFDQPVGPLW